MGLADRQTLLARIFTDAALRARFVADPQALGAEFGLGPDDAAWLEALSARQDQVRRFADSLRKKRRNDLGKMLPLSLRALGEARFAALLRRQAAAQAPGGSTRLRADAVAFARFAERVVRAGEAGPPWAADVLRYEAAWLVAAGPGRRCTVRWLRHNIHDLMISVPAGQDVPPPTRPTLAIWYRASRTGRLRHLNIALPGRSPHPPGVPTSRMLLDPDSG